MRRASRPPHRGGGRDPHPHVPFQPKRPMLKRNLWKLILCLALTGWAVWQLYPVKDTPFVDYIRTHATAKPQEFAQLLDEAAQRKKNLKAVSEFIALKQIGQERKLDLSQYFPDIRLEDTLKNVEKRNDILLTEL